MTLPIPRNTVAEIVRKRDQAPELKPPPIFAGLDRGDCLPRHTKSFRNYFRRITRCSDRQNIRSREFGGGVVGAAGCSAVIELVMVVLDNGLPVKVTEIDASFVAASAVVRRLMYWGWRLSLAQPQNYPMSRLRPAFMRDRAIAVRQTSKWPNKTILALVIEVGKYPSHGLPRRCTSSERVTMRLKSREVPSTQPILMDRFAASRNGAKRAIRHWTILGLTRDAADIATLCVGSPESSACQGETGNASTTVIVRLGKSKTSQ